MSQSSFADIISCTISYRDISSIKNLKQYTIINTELYFILNSPSTATPIAGDKVLDADSAYADHLLSTLGRGASTCAEIQESALAMLLESNGHCSNITRSIAKIGNWGKHPGNCERDLFRILTLPVESQA